jgi:hypothetical protein
MRQRSSCEQSGSRLGHDSSLSFAGHYARSQEVADVIAARK